VPTADGRSVTLDTVAQLEMGSGSAQITRFDRRRSVSIKADVGGAPLGEINEAIDKLPAIRSCRATCKRIDYGDTSGMNQLFADFGIAMVAGVLLVYCVLGAAVPRLRAAADDHGALPLSVGGALGLLLLAGEALSLPATIGILMLMGIVHEELDPARRVRARRAARGRSRRAAMLDACSKRARPIVMTTVAMGAGMLPIALKIGADADFRAPMAIAVIGGLLTSTVLSLFYVPVVFTYVDDMKQWLVRLFSRRRAGAGRAAANDDARGASRRDGHQRLGARARTLGGALGRARGRALAARGASAAAMAARPRARDRRAAPAGRRAAPPARCAAPASSSSAPPSGRVQPRGRRARAVALAARPRQRRWRRRARRGGAWLLHRWTRVDLRTCLPERGESAARSTCRRSPSASAPSADSSRRRTCCASACRGRRSARDGVRASATAARRRGRRTTTSFSARLRRRCSRSPPRPGWLARRIDVPNAWGIAPLLASCACAVRGLELGDVPAAVVHAGQLAVGWSLGSRFAPGFFSARRAFSSRSRSTRSAAARDRAPRRRARALASESVPSLVLGAAPGGVAEMSTHRAHARPRRRARRLAAADARRRRRGSHRAAARAAAAPPGARADDARPRGRHAGCRARPRAAGASGTQARAPWHRGRVDALRLQQRIEHLDEPALLAVTPVVGQADLAG
jgi:hypothetical protein